MIRRYFFERINVIILQSFDNPVNYFHFEATLGVGKRERI